MWTNRKIDFTTRLQQLIGNLHTRRASTNHHDRAVWQLLRVTIISRMDLIQIGIFGCDCWNHWRLKRACRGYYALSLINAFRGHHLKAANALLLRYAVNFDTSMNRRFEFFRIRFKVVCDTVFFHKAVWVNIRKLQPWKTVMPSWPIRHQ